ncbi:MAG: monovalent cation/H(+) antiporter subunit G [Rhodopila sp.]
MIAEALLVLVAVCVWIACIGFARLGNSFDRLHCVTFVAASAGPLIVALAFVMDGASNRTWKIALLVLLMLVNGAALAHATARTIAWRDTTGERS